MKSASSPSAKPRGTKQPSSSITSETDYDRLHAQEDGAIELTDEHPETDVEHLKGGRVRRGLMPASPKTAISLQVDTDVLDWFKAQGEGYQTRMNRVLRAFRDASV